MRWSTMHIPTLREDPADAGAPSHRLLLRAGYIRQLIAGHYSLLPLGQRTRLKVIAIIREEMNRAGAQEILMPVMHPAEAWQRSGRWETMGDEMFRVKDRKGADLALGMTHEEIVAILGEELNSYRELPQMWYQFQTKLRDEPRPKAGLMRTREFTMKDSYSFDLDAEGLDRSFDLHRQAYIRIFERLGIPAIGVEASSGTMGGSGSTEFVSPSQVGEDLIAHCGSCGYAANIEKATSRLREPDLDAERRAALPAPQPFATPGVKTIEDLAAGHGAPADRQIKTLVYLLNGQLTLVLLRGDHALQEQKLVDATGAVTIRPADAEEIFAVLGAHPGSLGAVNVAGIPIIADQALRGRDGMFTGANSDDSHLRGVCVDRDINVSRWADLREVTAGEPCVACGQPLEVLRGIEVGHIFKLGYKYADAMDLSVSGPDGKPVKPIMGSYGIGVERAMAAIIEAHHDSRGIVWPAAVAPFEAVVVVAQQEDAQVAEAGERVYGRLRDACTDVIIDDRHVRAGVKFSDSELVGIPLRITIGKRGLASGTAELTDRATGETVEVPLDDLPERVPKSLADALTRPRTLPRARSRESYRSRGKRNHRGTQDMSNLIAIAYDNVETAQTVRDKLFELQSQRLISMEDVAVVERKQDGRIKLHQARSATGAGAIGGALWGGLIGLIFFVPFLGAAFGAAAGAAAGAMSDSGVDDEFMREVGEDLQPGKAALFVLVMHSTPEKVLPELAPYGGHIMRTSLSHEADAQLREAMESAQKIPAARPGKEEAARAEHRR